MNIFLQHYFNRLFFILFIYYYAIWIYIYRYIYCGSQQLYFVDHFWLKQCKIDIESAYYVTVIYGIFLERPSLILPNESSCPPFLIFLLLNIIFLALVSFNVSWFSSSHSYKHEIFWCAEMRHHLCLSLCQSVLCHRLIKYSFREERFPSQ